jgi:hypothetical protein
MRELYHKKRPLILDVSYQSWTVAASPHTLRHSCATNWDGDTSTLQRMLGHSNLNTTQQYIHLQTKQLVERNNKHNGLLSLMSGELSLSPLSLDNHQDLLTSSQIN